MNTTIQYIGLALILLVYLCLACFYNTAIPFSKGPDELTHYLYAKFIGEHGRLPITPAERAETSTRAYLPPLYHLPVGAMMAATWTSYPPNEFQTESGDLFPPLRVSWEPATQQLVDIVLPRATLIRTEDERAPFRGEYLAWMVGRWVSTLVSAGTIILTFLISRILLPERPGLALTAAALIAFIPMFLFISAVLNDDTMVGLTMAGYLLLLALFLRGNDSPGLYIGMGLLIGLAVTTKYHTGLAALGATLVLWWSRRERAWSVRAVAKRVSLLWVTTLVASSWWFIWSEIYFNEVAKYGLIAGLLKPFAPDVDPTAHRFLSLFSDQLPDPGLPANGITGNFWDWLRRTFETSWALTPFGVEPYIAYWPLMVLLAILTIMAVWGSLLLFKQAPPFQHRWMAAFGLHFALVLPLPLIRFLATYRINDTAQGRHLFFPAAPALILLLLVGWDYWLPARYKPVASLVGLGGLLLWAVGHGWYLFTAYPAPLPVRTTPSPAMNLAHTTQVDFAETVRLLGYEVQQVTHTPVLKLDLLWQSLGQAWEDYRTEIMLVDQAGQPALVWLSQPARGRFPVRAWQPGDFVRDTLYIPLAGLPAGDYTVKLRLLGWDEPLSTEREAALPLTTVVIGETPAAELALWQQDVAYPPASTGSDLPIYRYRATIPVTLTDDAEIVSARDPYGQTHQPVTAMGPLQTFMVDYRWPSGEYSLQIDQEEVFKFQVENFDSRRQNGWNFTPPVMANVVRANFADKIELLGYDLPMRRVAPGEGIPLVLYWRGLTQMRNDYKMAVQLLNVDLERYGGYDRLPRETYNTYLWVPGEVVDDGFAVPVEADAPDGVYTIRLGWYLEAEDQITPLPLIHDGQALQETGVVIGPLKIGGPPPTVRQTTDEAASTQAALAHFGEPSVIALQDYTVQRNNGSLTLTLQWESLAPTANDWSVFVHLRDQSDTTVAQKDGPAGNGRYPTSLWDAGEIITDQISLPLADDITSGEYKLVVGLYDLSTGVRLPVSESVKQEILLTALEVPPQ